MIRALVVDDEPLARRGARDLLAAEPDVEVVGEAADGGAAVERLARGGVDVVLLDVQMPGLDGFEVLRRLEPPLPAVVFATAYDDYALQAFDAHAVDYLLKPIRPERFREAMRRVRLRLDGGERAGAERRLAALLEQLDPRLDVADRLLVRSGSRTLFVPVAGIEWIEAAGNYARLHTADGAHLVRETMTDLARRLEAQGLVRIHRSYIVRLDAIEEVQPWFKGDHVVILRDGTRLPLTRRYRPALEARVGRRL